MSRVTLSTEFTFGWLLLLGACSTQGPDRSATQLSAGQQLRCAGRAVHVAIRLVELDSSAACALVEHAIGILGTADSTQTSLVPTDTARVRNVRLTALTETDSLDRELTSWWVVNLELPGRKVNAEVRVDKSTQAAAVRPVHR